MNLRRQAVPAGALAVVGSGIAALARRASKSTREVARSAREDERTERLLALFDDLDFNVFSHHLWDELKRSHAEHITVYWPDGHVSRGLKKHIEELRALGVPAPDMRINVHPVRFGAEGWTAVTGWIEGTFTEPMPMPDGKLIPPTGKSFHLPMATIAHWNDDDLMDAEYLFWDNQTYLKQLGVLQ